MEERLDSLSLVKSYSEVSSNRKAVIALIHFENQSFNFSSVMLGLLGAFGEIVWFLSAEIPGHLILNLIILELPVSPATTIKLPQSLISIHEHQEK